MPKLHPLPAKKMIKILKKIGFKLLRVNGSHHFFLNSETSRTTTVPVHNNEVLSVGILKEILRDIELGVDDYEKLRRKA